MNKKRDYYEILGIDKSATPEEIKRAFRKLARKYHPDVSEEHNAREKFKEINEAYQVLYDPVKRQKYDQFGHANINGQGFDFGNFQEFDFGDIFGDISSFFGGGRGHGQTESKQKIYQLKIKFMEAMHGIEKEIVIETEHFCSACDGTGAESQADLKWCQDCNGRGIIDTRNNTIFGMIFNQQKTCKKCNGTGTEIKNKCNDCRGNRFHKKKETITAYIPKGLKNGQYIEISKWGKINLLKKTQTPILLQIIVIPHPVIKHVEDNHLFTEVPINFLEALLGKDIFVPTIDGVKKIELRPLTTHKKIVRLKGFGAYDPNNPRKRGDHYFRIMIHWPEKLSREMKKKLAELELGEENDVNKNFINELKKRNLI